MGAGTVSAPSGVPVKIRTSIAAHAKVTGGTGAFRGATGTFKAVPISGTRTRVTIAYHT